MPSIKEIRSTVMRLTEVVPQFFDCCPNICMAFVGTHSTLDTCLECHEPRRIGNSPRCRYQYLPLITILKSFYAGKDIANAMLYRHRKQFDNIGTDAIHDVYDSTLYRELCRKNVEFPLGGLVQPYKYFSDPRDILLGAATDG